MKSLKFLLGFFVIYLFLVFPIMRKPLVADELCYAKPAELPWSYVNILGPASPPTYTNILRLFSHLFNLHDNGLRIVGMICFLVNLLLILKLSQQLFKDKRVGVLAGFLFTLNPMAIQGSMILDIDNTVLTVFLMLTILYLSRNSNTLNFRNGIFLTLLFFISLWTKFSTPFILIGSLILFYFFKRDIKSVFKIFFIGISAVLIFLIVWKAYSLAYNFRFSLGFNRNLSVIKQGVTGISLPANQELILRALRVSLWVGIYIVFFWVIAILRRIKEVFLKKEQLGFSDFLIIYSVCIFVGYILIGGLNFGFAKYHYPILPILSIIIANTVLGLEFKSLKRYFLFYVPAALILVYLNILFLKDPLYQINFNLRNLGIFYPDKALSFLKVFSLRLFFCVFFLFLAVEIIRRLTRELSFWRVFYLFSIIFILLNNFYTDIYLRNAKFFTTFCYGRDINEFKQVAAFCKKKVAHDKNVKIISPEDVLYLADAETYVGYDELWNRRDKFSELIKEDKVGAVIYAFTFNAVFSYKNIFFNPLVLGEFRNRYSFRQFGEYTIWERK